MFMGIDVGGTYTDGVLYDGQTIVHTVKQPTDTDDLQKSLLAVLDELLRARRADVPVERIVLSTTLVTNHLATGKAARTALILLPGYGLPHTAYKIAPDTFFLNGSIDFRGREIDPVKETEVIRLGEQLKSAGIRRAAIAGKFSNRNRSHENTVRRLLEEVYPQLAVTLSADLSNRLNFPRRATTAYYTAVVAPEWNRFADEIEKAVRQRQPGVDLHILKADGGTMPISVSRCYPCETVFSGPAASTMGALALTMDRKNSLVIDVGGTTSDLALLVDGLPLHASRGAQMQGHYSHIRAISVRSVPIGGDSPIGRNERGLSIGSERLGPAACLGGPTATVTDVFNYRLCLGVGEVDRSRAALQGLLRSSAVSIEQMCDQLMERVINTLVEETRQMFVEWENEPAYRVWEVVHRTPFRLDRVVGIGAAASALVPKVAQELGVEPVIHHYSPVANALGAAVVRPTLNVYLHLDTEQTLYTVEPGGIVEKRGDISHYQLTDARDLVLTHLRQQAQQRGMASYQEDYQFFMEEQFNLIRGWDRSGRIFDLGVQIAPGLIDQYQGVTT